MVVECLHIDSLIFALLHRTHALDTMSGWSTPPAVTLTEEGNLNKHRVCTTSIFLKKIILYSPPNRRCTSLCEIILRVYYVH